MQRLSLLIDFGLCFDSDIMAVNLKVFNLVRSSRNYKQMLEFFVPHPVAIVDLSK